MKQMQKIPYQKQMDELLLRLEAEKRTPTLLLHSCCAPCSSYVMEYLSRYFELTVLYYNPNISPQEEYRKREEELARLIREMPFRNPVHMIAGRYEPEVFRDAVRGLEQEPEGGERCGVCFRLRLEEAARAAKKLDADYFATTLTISPMKDAQRLNAIGEETARRYGVAYLLSDFKKKNGFKRSGELSREYGLYRQDFCGCIYSRLEQQRRKENSHGTALGRTVSERDGCACKRI